MDFTAFLALLTRILGADNALVVALTDANEADGAETAPDDAGLPDDSTDEAREFVSALWNVSDETLTEVLAAVREEAPEMATEDLVAAQTAVEQVRYVQDVRAEAATTEAEQRAALLEAIDPVDQDDGGDGGDGGDGEDGGDGGDGGDAADGGDDGDGGEEAEAADEPELVTAAAAPAVGNVGRRVQRSRSAPDPEPQNPRTGWRMLDGSRPTGARLGQDEMTARFADMLHDIGDQHGDQPTTYQRLARMEVDYPSELRLSEQDPIGNGRRIEHDMAAVRAAMETSVDPMAQLAELTAAGGVCAPAQPIYEIATVGDDGRPVRDFLASRQLGKGGAVTFRPGYRMSTAFTNTVDSNVSGVGVRTNAQDIAAATKPLLTLTCPTAVTVTVQAITARAQFGNFMDRFDPDNVAAILHEQRKFWARIAETQLINAISTNSVALVVPAADVGAAAPGFSRTLLNRLEMLAVGIRDRERMPANAVIDMLAPHWTPNAIRADLVYELPGAAVDRLAQTDAQIAGYFAQRNIRIGYFRDTQNFPAQGIGIQAEYPTDIQVYAFEPGHFVFLDGGVLDLGVVRDSTLNGTNDQQTFMESFEALAYPGVVAYRLTTDTCVSGATAGTVTPACNLGS